jgi:aryl-alcohol dehydrogenase-like predicted oxidoreductase
MRRRRFLSRSVSGITGLAGFVALGLGQKLPAPGVERLPLARRALGRTGARLSIVGLGGVVLMNESPASASRIVSEAVDLGVNYFDVAPSYGNAQELLGPALKPYRAGAFLACKTTMRDAAGAAAELEGSLKALATDHLDLYQLHALTTLDDVRRALGPRGALETFVKARQEGKIGHIGFSAHSVEAALEAMKQFDFATILFPVNFVCWYKAGFGPEVVKAAEEKGMGVLAIKALARAPWTDEDMRRQWPKLWYQPVTDPGQADKALRFTLSQPVTAAVPPGDIRMFRLAVDIAQSFTVINEKEERDLRDLAATLTPIFPQAQK